VIFSDAYSQQHFQLLELVQHTSDLWLGAFLYPEIPWNDSCAGALVSLHFQGFSPNLRLNKFLQRPKSWRTPANHGRRRWWPSGCATGIPSVTGVVSGTCKGWPKPSWQSVLGNPQDGVAGHAGRVLSLPLTVSGVTTTFFCWSDTANGGACVQRIPKQLVRRGRHVFRVSHHGRHSGAGEPETRRAQGNPNLDLLPASRPTEYGTAGNSSCNSSNGTGVASTCVFNDVTLGDMDVNCTGNHNCYLPSGSVGVLSTSNNSIRPGLRHHDRLGLIRHGNWLHQRH